MKHLTLVCLVVIALHSLVIVCDFMKTSVSSIKDSFENPFETTPPIPHTLQCDGLYLNLLEGVKDIPATAFVREFFETEGCDDVFNMSDHRREYVVRVNFEDNSRMTRVFNFISDERDELIVAQAVIHYHHWHESRLISALTPMSRIGYTIVSQMKQILALGYDGMGLNSFWFIKLKSRYLRGHSNCSIPEGL